MHTAYFKYNCPLNINYGALFDIHSLVVYSIAAVDCGDLSDPMNGDVQVARTTFGAVAVYECEENYDLVGSQSRICQADASWSGFRPTCECKLVTFKTLV